MNEYRPALDVLRERRKGKPGELGLMLGIVLMIAAPVALALQQANGEKLDALKSEGRVTEAIVKEKSVRSESYTDNKGRQKSRDIHMLNLQHDINAELNFADWSAGKAFVKPQYPAVTTTSVEVGEAYYDALSVGAKTTVVRNPSDYDSMMLTEQVEYETSFAYNIWWYLGGAAAFLAGLVLTAINWRKRFPRA
ncbi:hypothetical protein DXH95_07885 [Sphingorhabdus pulchriflava]|uniref:Transmembrane protein n=1 Tax=Sphingorhabdus pulchriflava TaxID=2292257 RepID=A0A371BIQ5_9SPHN|nr:hypothetical protein [Sphingorhabdus pulchriflava]RDV07273.1 hypothetical protein DXH95_07885 [Sphingorhabdus pulchriflava]